MAPNRPTRAVLAAAFTASLLELLTAAVRGATHRFDYSGVALATSLVFAGLLAAGARALRARTAVALALWAFASSTLVTGLAAGLGTATSVLLVGRSRRGRTLRASRLGVLVGGSFAASVIVGLRVTPRLPAAWPGGVAPVVLCALLLLAGLLPAARLAPRLASRALLAPGALLLLALAGYGEIRPRLAGPPPRHRSAGPHVFLIVLDTVRADHLSIYGYGRDTTPKLAQRLADHPGAVVYPWAFSNGAWTAPSHATLLTGRLPSQHEVHLGTAAAATTDWSMPTRFTLHADRTLAERFRAAGYATLAVYANPWLDRIDGLSRGFDVYTRVRRPRGLPLVAEQLRQRLAPSWFLDEVHFDPPARAVVSGLLADIDRRPERRLFVLANFLDAHAPYRPPPESRGRYAAWSPFERPQELSAALPDQQKKRLMARYDESIRSLDAALETLFEGLEARGILADSWLFVTADHGEAFGEHGATDHGTAVYNEEVHVPLVVFPPRGTTLAPATGPVSLASVAATAAAIAGLPLAEDADLRAGGPGRAVVEFYADPGKAKSQGSLGAEPAQALVAGSKKLVRYRDHAELFDLAADPAERRDLAPREPRLAGSLGDALPPIGFRRADSAVEDSADPELREQLEALGYLERE